MQRVDSTYPISDTGTLKHEPIRAARNSGAPIRVASPQKENVIRQFPSQVLSTLQPLDHCLPTGQLQPIRRAGTE